MSSSAPLVLVTGISGFIGSWVGYAALKLGYRVRGTVRSLSNPKKVQHLKELCPGAAHELELVEADLTSETGWDAAVKDVDYILHVASPFPVFSPKDKMEIIKPAVDGTLNVLKAASRLEVPPKRVIVTSSFAAVGYGQKTEGVIFNEDFYTPVDDPKVKLDPYIESKSLAEKAAWKFVNELPENKKFELATINPTLVIGPPLGGSDCSSIDIYKQILLGEIPVVPNIEIQAVSMFDVVRAHLIAMRKPEAAGKRFLCHSGVMTLPDTSDMLVKEYKPLGYRPSTLRVSKTILRIASLFDSKARDVLNNLDKNISIDPRNSKEILGIKFNEDVPGLIKTMINGAIQAGIIVDKSKDKTISKSFVRPEIDLTGVPTASD